jgi:hypothetical protein
MLNGVQGGDSSLDSADKKQVVQNIFSRSFAGMKKNS